MSERMMDLEDDWQSNKSVVECNRYMWTTKEASDVTFIVGEQQERITAHKYVLLSRSRVFFAMFVGPLSNNTGAEVTIPDVEPDTFKALLVFLYCDEVTVDLNNVLALLYVGKKYCVQSLINKCINKLKSNMVYSNVCTVMETAHTYGNDELRERCKTLILKDPNEVFRSDTFVELCSDCLAMIISDDNLSLKEEHVFKAVMDYSEQQCRQRQWDVTPENTRQVLGNALKEIRFPLMDHHYFVDEVEPSKLLPDCDLVVLMKYFLKKEGPCQGFNTKPRKLLSILLRFAEMGADWGYKRDKVDAISFSCSKDVLIYGIHVFGSKCTPCVYEMRLKLLQEPYRGILVEKRFQLETDGMQRTYQIQFDNPAKIEKEKVYTFEMTMRGQESFSGEQGDEETEKDGVTFKFSDTKKSTNNTTIKRGQIPGIVFEEVPAENTQM